MPKELLKLFIFVFFLISIGKISAAVRTFETPVSLSEIYREVVILLSRYTIKSQILWYIRQI